MKLVQEQEDPMGVVGRKLDIIVAVVIGGGSLSGSEGSLIGCLIGAIIMNGMSTQWLAHLGHTGGHRCR